MISPRPRSALSLIHICRTEDLTLPAGSLYYVGHWITPEGPPRRYDTRFFAALAPPGQTAGHDEIETIEHMWVSPADALDQNDGGRIELLFPTVWNLRLLARYPTSADLIASASSFGVVPTIEPTQVLDEQGRRSLIVNIDPDKSGAG